MSNKKDNREEAPAGKEISSGVYQGVLKLRDKA